MDDLGGSFVGIAGTNADEVRANHNDWSANAGPSMHDLYQICNVIVEVVLSWPPFLTQSNGFGSIASWSSFAS